MAAHAFSLTLDPISLPFGELQVCSYALLPEMVVLTTPDRPFGSMLFRAIRDHLWGQTEELLSLLTLVPATTAQVDSLAISLEPQFPVTLTFDVLRYALPQGGFWYFMPALGVGHWVADADPSTTALVPIVRLALTRQRRLSAPKQWIPCQWFGPLNHQSEPLELEESSLPIEAKDWSAYHRKNRRKFSFSFMTETLGGSATWLERAASPFKPHKTTCVARDALLTQLGRSLAPPQNTSVLLVGPPGVGKSTLLSALFHQAATYGLKNLPVWETTAARLVQRLCAEGPWQPALAQLVAELHAQKGLLYVGNLAQLFEVGRYVGNATSIGEFLRTRLADGELRLIAECTPEELALVERRAPGYGGLFVQLRVPVPTNEAIHAMVAARFPSQVTADGIDEALGLLRRYAPYASFPGVVMELLRSLLRTQPAPLNRQAVVRGFCRRSGMPTPLVDSAEPFDPAAVRATFQHQVFGQPAAIERLLALLLALKTRLNRPLRPLGSLLFIGPTGVGKTALAKALAEYLFGNAHALIRFDMSEYADPLAVLRLMGDGSPNGEGLLTSAVRQDPFAVVLFDELEKAHPSFYDLLLQILGEGRLTDARGQVVSFCSCVIIMTSNLGAQEARRTASGFHRDRDDDDHYLQVVHRFFRPELVNRFDSILPFQPLDGEQLRQVAARELRLLHRRPGLQDRPVVLRWEDAVLDQLAHASQGPFGARQLQRALQDRLVSPLAAALNRHLPSQALTVTVQATDVGPFKVRVAVDTSAALVKQRAVAQSLVAHIAQIGDGRRASQAVLAGPFALMLQNQWDQREQARQQAIRQKREAAFWVDQAQAADYHVLRQQLDQGQALHAHIGRLEQRGYQGLLDSTPADGLMDDLAEEFGQWQQGFQQRFLALCATAEPQNCRRVVGIYGADWCVAEYGQQLDQRLRWRGWSVARHTVWLMGQEGRYAYGDAQGYRHPITGAWLTTGGQPIGEEWQIDGVGVAPYLAYEVGRHLYYREAEPSTGELAVVVLADTREAAKTPGDVHRKAFLQTLPRGREYAPNSCRDPVHHRHYVGPYWLATLDGWLWQATREALWRRSTGEAPVAWLSAVWP